MFIKDIGLKFYNKKNALKLQILLMQFIQVKDGLHTTKAGIIASGMVIMIMLLIGKVTERELRII